MNYKQKALDHVRSVCPELKGGLEFGCKVRVFGKELTFVHLISHENGTHTPYYIAPNGSLHNGTYTHEEMQSITIIGHTPHLEHWLRGIKGYVFEGNIISVFRQVVETDEVIKTDIPYNLTKDGENQSE